MRKKILKVLKSESKYESKEFTKQFLYNIG